MSTRLFLLLLSLFAAPCAFSQEAVDSVPPADTLHARVTAVVPAKPAKTHETDSLLRTVAALQATVTRLQADTAALNVKLRQAEGHSDELMRQVNAADSILFNISANYLYVPYLDYEVNELAIPAFNHLYDRALRDKYAIRLKLLEQYKAHILQMLAFFKKVEAMKKNPFNASEDYVKLLKAEAFYKDYVQMPHYEETYLGKTIKEIERSLVNKSGLDKITKQLEDCLKNAES